MSLLNFGWTVDEIQDMRLLQIFFRLYRAQLIRVLNIEFESKKVLTVIMAKKDINTLQNGPLTSAFIWSKIISILFSFAIHLNDFYQHIATR